MLGKPRERSCWSLQERLPCYGMEEKGEEEEEKGNNQRDSVG